MATYTSPDGIYKPDSTDQVTPLETPFANMATTIQTAFDKREIYTYRWADASERNATTGMRNGDTGYQADEDTVYRRYANSWKVWERPEKVYTPITTNLTLGTGGATDARYMVTGGIVFVQIRTTLGTSGFVMGDVRYSLPLAADTNGLTVTSSTFGNATFYDASAGTHYTGVSTYLDANTIRPLLNQPVSTTGVKMAAVSASLPMTWAASDRLHIWANYRISL